MCIQPSTRPRMGDNLADRNRLCCTNPSSHNSRIPAVSIFIQHNLSTQLITDGACCIFLPRRCANLNPAWSGGRAANAYAPRAAFTTVPCTAWCMQHEQSQQQARHGDRRTPCWTPRSCTAGCAARAQHVLHGRRRSGQRGWEPRKVKLRPLWTAALIDGHPAGCPRASTCRRRAREAPPRSYPPPPAPRHLGRRLVCG